MRFVKLSAKEIVELVRENETVKVECKEALGGLPDSLWETYSSFANTDGGVILLGVKELKNRKMQIQGVADPAALIKQFWNTVNNREKVSANILFDRHVYSVDCDGKAVVVVEVPRADRQTRPVYVGEDMFKGTYRRNGEGDYHCPRESVKALIRDQLDRTADQTVVDKLTFDDLNKDTIRFYRRQFKDIHPNRKEIVAKRLVVHALKRDYGFEIPEDDSPVFKSVSFADGKATLKFDHVKSWYVYDPEPWIEPPFELAGTNGVWTAAKLVNEVNRNWWEGSAVKGVDLVLEAEGVKEPVKVRYMGRDKTMGDLFNEASLPLGPFETK